MIMTVTAGVVGGLNGNQICNEFVEGTKSLLWVGLVMGLCKGVTNILTEANIIDTIINALASLLHGLPRTVAACAMFAVQDVINFVIPSGSGQVRGYDAVNDTAGRLVGDKPPGECTGFSVR